MTTGATWIYHYRDAIGSNQLNIYVFVKTSFVVGDHERPHVYQPTAGSLLQKHLVKEWPQNFDRTVMLDIWRDPTIQWLLKFDSTKEQNIK